MIRPNLVVPPTENHDLVLQAIDGLAIASSTAIGDGILEAVYALPGRLRPPAGMRRAAPSVDAGPDTDRLPPAAVVLLSDGVSNTGTDPYDAAAVAVRLRVKVYTVGLGTPDASSDALDEDTLMGSPRHREENITVPPPPMSWAERIAPRTLYCVDVAADRDQRACLGWSGAVIDVHALGFLFLDGSDRLTRNDLVVGQSWKRPAPI